LYAQFLLARALWDSGGDRRRARTLAGQARDGYAGLEAGEPAVLADLERWLAAHPLRSVSP
jgi:hypothetical protein